MAAGGEESFSSRLRGSLRTVLPRKEVGRAVPDPRHHSLGPTRTLLTPEEGRRGGQAWLHISSDVATGLACLGGSLGLVVTYGFLWWPTGARCLLGHCFLGFIYS